MRKLKINGDIISDEAPCYIIAEVGNNHQGEIEKCKTIFRAAKNCGCHAVKLQKRNNRALFTQAAYNSPYVNRNSFGKTYGQHRDFLEFGHEEYVELKRFCDEELKITLFATPFDFESADFLENVGMPAYKIASGDLTNIPLIKHVAAFGKPVIISTGGGTLADVHRAYEAAKSLNGQLSIMQCTSGYPPNYDQLNLEVIKTFKKEFPDIVIGYSGHENGIAIPVAAYTLGARIIEKHFTVDRTWKGTDQALSLAPTGMRKLVRDLTRTRAALGNGQKAAYPCEDEPLQKMVKSLVAARNLKCGEVLGRKDIAIRVPAGGIPPYEIEKFIGKALTRDLPKDAEFEFSDIAE